MVQIPERDHEALCYAMSFLAILVDRAGGSVTIPKFSEYNGRNVLVGMEIDRNQDEVRLRFIEPGRN